MKGIIISVYDQFSKNGYFATTLGYYLADVGCETVIFHLSPRDEHADVSFRKLVNSFKPDFTIGLNDKSVPVNIGEEKPVPHYKATNIPHIAVFANNPDEFVGRSSLIDITSENLSVVSAGYSDSLKNLGIDAEIVNAWADIKNMENRKSCLENRHNFMVFTGRMLKPENIQEFLSRNLEFNDQKLVESFLDYHMAIMKYKKKLLDKPVGTIFKEFLIDNKIDMTAEGFSEKLLFMTRAVEAVYRSNICREILFALADRGVEIVFFTDKNSIDEKLTGYDNIRHEPELNYYDFKNILTSAKFYLDIWTDSFEPDNRLAMAMADGCVPVITEFINTDNVILENTDNMIGINLSSFDQAAEKIKEIADDKEAWEKISEANKDFAVKNFSMSRLAKSIVEKA